MSQIIRNCMENSIPGQFLQPIGSPDIGSQGRAGWCAWSTVRRRRGRPCVPRCSRPHSQWSGPRAPGPENNRNVFIFQQLHFCKWGAAIWSRLRNVILIKIFKMSILNNKLKKISIIFNYKVNLKLLKI